MLHERSYLLNALQICSAILHWKSNIPAAYLRLTAKYSIVKLLNSNALRMLHFLTGQPRLLAGYVCAVKLESASPSKMCRH